MSTTTLPHSTGADWATRSASPSDERDPRTDEELRKALRAVSQSGSWETPDGHALLAEVRRRGARNAAHVAAATGVAMERGLVDDVLLAAWMVLRRHGDTVLAAARPWAYLMSSAQKQVLDEIRAQQLLTNTASIRGRAREALPSIVRPVGSTATDLARRSATNHRTLTPAMRGGSSVRSGSTSSHPWSPAVNPARRRRCVSGSHGSAHSSTYSSHMVQTRPSPWLRSTGSPICSPPLTSAGGNGQLAATPSWRSSA
jgi:hypothetical protein